MRVVALLLLAVSLAACSSAEALPSHVLRVADGHSLYSSFNPYLTNSIEEGDLVDLTSAPLLRWDINLTLYPDLLTDVPSRANGDVSTDFRRITLHLRPNLRWSDGEPLTARDILFTYHLMLQPGGPFLSESWRQVRSMRVVNGTTVEFTVKVPDADFMSRYLFGGMRFILPEHVLAGAGRLDHASAYNRMPVGAGPYRFVRVDPQTEIVLEANPYYWGEKPKIKRIEVHVVPDSNLQLVQMRTHELDMLANFSPDSQDAARAVPGLHVLGERGTYSLLNIVFNGTSPLGGDLRLREALRYATNRPALANFVYHEASPVFEEMFIPQDVMNTPLPRVPYDPKRAKAMLDAMGWHPGPDGVRVKDGKRLVLEMIAPSDNLSIDKTIEIVRANWRQAGVEMNVQRQNDSIYNSLDGRVAKGDFDALIREWTNGSTFVVMSYGCRFWRPDGFNFERFCDQRVENVFAELKKVDSIPGRRKLYLRMERIVEDAAVQLNLVQMPAVVVTNERVRGAGNSPLNFWDTVREADVL